MRYKFSLSLLFKFGPWQDVTQTGGDHRFYDETYWNASVIPGLYWTYE